MKRTRKKHSTEQNTRKITHILSCDPSMTAWGYSVISWNGNVVDSGCIKTESFAKKLKIRKGDERVQRISILNNELKKVIEQYNINLILSELPHGSQNAAASVMLGITAAIPQTISNFLNIGIEWYSEGDVKKHLFDRQNVTKQEMVSKMRHLYPEVNWTGIKYKDEAIADSLGIYTTAKYQSTAISLFLK